MEPNTPENREYTERNPDGTFKPGVSGNPGGRPKNTLKDYVSRKFSAMSDEEKEAWLLEHKITGIDQWKMAEGNPPQALDHTTDGQPMPQPIYAGLSIQGHNSDQKDIQPQKEN